MTKSRENNAPNIIDYMVCKSRHDYIAAYQRLLSEIQNNPQFGKFRTPSALTGFITDRIKPQIGENILDPVQGTRGFLSACIDYMRKSGIDINEHKMKVKNSQHGADIIVSTLPFKGTVSQETLATFPAKYQSEKSADLFLVIIINSLKKYGRAGIILPDNSLTGVGAKARIREKLLSDCRLHTIIRLPKSVFKPFTSVATNMLFFDKINEEGDEKNQFATKEIWYYQHNMPQGIKSYSKKKPIQEKEFEPLKKWWDNRRENKLSWHIDFTKILDKAKVEAKPHYINADEANANIKILKQQLSSTIRSKDAGADDILKIETKIRENEIKAYTEKQTAEKIYYSAFDLDIKNPHI